jgi:hypothetical protein
VVEEEEEENQDQGDQEEDGAGWAGCVLGCGAGRPSCGLAVAAPAARAWASHVSRVLWSTGQTASPLEDVASLFMADVF